MGISAQELIDRARQRADFQGNPFLNDVAELLPWCRESYKELWDLMISAYGEDYLVAQSVLAVPPQGAGTIEISTIDPPFYKAVAFIRLVNGIGSVLRRFNLQDQALDTNRYSWGDRIDLYYRITGNSIFFQPVPNATESVVLLYIPQATLDAVNEEIDPSAEPWAEYIVIDLAIKMRRKEQSDTADLMLEKEAMKQRIIQMATPRDAASPQRVIDVRTDEVIPSWCWDI